MSFFRHCLNRDEHCRLRRGGVAGDRWLLRVLALDSPRRLGPRRGARRWSLIGFAWTLTLVDSAFAGRVYAAYGGIYIVASLIWLWIAEHQRPNATDLVGAGLAIAGALVIIGSAPKGP